MTSISEWHQIVGDRQRCRTRADERNLFSVFLQRGRGKQIRHISAIVRGNALQAADRDRLAVDAAAAAGRLARTIARAPENAREHVRFPVEHVGVRKPSLGDEADVLGDVRVGRTGPLAIHDTVVVIRMTDVSWAHLPEIIGHAANC